MPGFYSAVDKDTQYADLTKLPFGDQYFDMVIGNHIMEHVPDDRKAMKEIYRILQPGGSAILQIPFSNTGSSTIEEPGMTDPKQQSALFGQKDHVRIYSLKDYLERLREAGFSVEYLSDESLSTLHQYATQPGEGFIRLRRE